MLLFVGRRRKTTIIAAVSLMSRATARPKPISGLLALGY
jgi:hypothetical protein